MHIEGVKIMEEYTMEDITSIRAFGILYWESSSSYLRARKAVVTTDRHAVSVMKGGDIVGHVP